MYRLLLSLCVSIAVLGCSSGGLEPLNVWGQFGVVPGSFSRPRAIAIDPEDRLFVVDFTARIQAFSLEGEFLEHVWTTPDFRNGRPSGLGIDRDGHLIVADSHYHCFRVYNHLGEELRRFGGTVGNEPGTFGYISDVVQDVEGNYYVSEFGLNDRITKLDSSGNHLLSWGKLGLNPGEFNRLRALAIGPDGLLYVADSCNHRIQVFDLNGNFIRKIGESGNGLGQLAYPYDVAFAPDGTLVVAEYGNHRVQRFNLNGESLGIWGKPGRKPGMLSNPWAVIVDRHGRVHVVDTENHRVQTFRF